MKRTFNYLLRKFSTGKKMLAIFTVLLISASCEDILEPQPVDLITDDEVLTDAGSAQVVVSGIYRGFASLAAPKIVAGDMMADHLQANGTFTQYIEIGNHDLSTSNGSAEALWEVIYDIAYRVNFLLEGLPEVTGLLDTQRERFEAEARFIRAYAYWLGAYTYGDIPIVTSTNITDNRTVGRTPFADVLAYVEEEFLYTIDKLPVEPQNAGFLSNGAAKAMLARYYLYRENWGEAERYATEVIDGVNTFDYTLEANFEDVLADFSSESILEIVYSANDNPGTSTDFGINNLFVGRREIIPTDPIIFALNSLGGERDIMLNFDADNLGGNDNGWTIVRYGPFDNIPIFRLAEMYLIRAEARARQDRVTGAGGGLQDLITVRQRSANADDLQGISGQSQLLQAIERERQVELAFEGHRWYDLKRTGRAASIMNAFTPNWSDTDLLWPIPLREVQNNPALRNAQNPGY
ncbi:MAG: RagB/SusD family nutrient uptake outer membrane protein [Cyclobacteriaceae bacterium]